MQNLSLFIKRIKKWSPEKRFAEKCKIQEKKRKLETKRRDIQAQIDALAILLDAVYTIDSGNDIPEVSYYKDKVRVSDHALIRYMDRELKIDTDLFRQEFINSMPDKIPRNAATLNHKNMVFQLVWLSNQIVVKTFYKRKNRKRIQP